jgi:hypothetical protein
MKLPIEPKARQWDTPVAIDGDGFCEVTGSNHRVFGTTLALLEWLGRKEQVQHILDSLKAPSVKQGTLCYYERAKRCLGYE